MQSVLAALNALDDSRHRAELYRMWAAGHSAGFTHPKSFETMGERASPATEAARHWLLDGTSRGKSLADVLRSGGKRFDEFERALLTLGEESGRLDDALKQLGEFYTKRHTLILWVKKKMAYPLFTAMFACFILPFPLAFFGHTRAYIVASFSALLLLLLFAGSIVAAVANRYGRKPPLVRARMARALSSAIDAGLTLPRAIRLAADASASPEIRAFVHRFSEQQLATGSIGATLAGCPHLTKDFLGTLEVAERTGDFRPLARLADLYEDGFR